MNRRDPTIADMVQQAAPLDIGALLEATGRGEMTMAQLTVALSQHCRGDADAVWETLALADQYFRRGRINADIFAAIKAGLHSLVFPPTQHTPNAEHQRPDNKQSADSELQGHKLPSNTPRETRAPAIETLVSKEAVPKTPRNATASTTGVPKDRVREDVTEARVASKLATAAIKPPNRPQNYFHEPSYSRASSAWPKVLIGTGVVVAAVIVIAYIFLTNKPAPPLPTAKSSDSQPELPAISEPSSKDERANLSGFDLTAPGSTTSESARPELSKSDVSIAAAPPIGDERNTANATSHAAARTTTEPASSSRITEARVPPVIHFVVDPIVVDQSDSAARIVVHRSGSARREWSVQWRTVEGSAKAERDFVATSNGVLSFSPGAHDAVILVPIVKDSTRRHADWFEVEVMADSTELANASPDSLRAMIVIQSVQAATESEETGPSAAPSSVPSPSSGSGNVSVAAPDTT